MNGQSLNIYGSKKYWNVPVQKDVQVCVVGKVFRPNRLKVLALNRTIIEYKALLEGIEVKYLTKKETRNASKTCHRCGHVARVEGRAFKCPKCGMEYDRDLNACINIAHRVTSSMGWGSRESPEPADEAGVVKPQLNAGSSRLQSGSSSLYSSSSVTA
jgi:X-X-X-Leu-X-X-Gly heptad repeat protein